MALKSIFDNRYKALVVRLTERRLALGMKQSELGKALGKTQQFVSRYEQFERRLDIVEYLDAAHVLGLDGMDEVSTCWKPLKR